MSFSSDPDGVAETPEYGADALIISRKHHPITVDMIDPDALKVLRKLNSSGFVGYLVGGGVRDLYLGKKPKDFDISTDAKPGQIRKLFPHSATIGRRFRLVQVFFRGGKVIEVSTLRSLSEHDLDGPEHVLAPNNTFGTLSEDAQRRDLTINALFFEINNKIIIDYVHGVKDLQSSTVRMVGAPVKRIIHDPVRMMRAIRHSARNNFTIEEHTWKAICSNSGKLALCPPSRLRDETLKDVYSGDASPWFDLAMKSGIFPFLFSLYRPLLSKDSRNSTAIATQLSHIFDTIDRTNKIALEHKIHRQSDFFFLALILVPWAESRYQLFSTYRKGPQLFQVSKKIREKLDQTMGIDLNLRRSIRQEIVSLLTNLSSLIHNRKNGSWPKRLQNKSYFKKCSLFYNFYIETTGGTSITEEQLESKSLRQDKPKPLPRRKSSPGKTKPAFSTAAKGGIFGFKK